MLKYASILTFVILLITVAIYNDRVNHNAVAVKTFDLNHGLIVQLEPFPVQVEEQTHWRLIFNKDSSQEKPVIQDAWVEGVNMYMGRISAYVEPTEKENEIVGWFFLGSCSEPKMQWRLYIKLKGVDGEEATYHFDFFTEI